MTGKKYGILLLTLVLTSVFLFQNLVFANDPEFKLSIDTEEFPLGSSANLTLSLVNANDAQIAGIEGIDNFEVSSPSQSTSTRIFNGDTTFQTDVRYPIMPKKTGTFTLKGIVTFKGKTYETNVIQVKVNQPSDTEEGEGQDIFLKTVVTNNEIYVGQKIPLVYELYSRYSVENFGFAENVSIDGFMVSDVPVKDNDYKTSFVYIGSIKYLKIEVKNMYIYPIKEGNFKIPEFNFDIIVSTGGGFFSSSEKVRRKTVTKELKVKPLPQTDKPSDFTGLVGTLNVDSSYSKNDLSVGESLTLKVTATGSCNLENLEKIIKSDIPGLSVYETEGKMEESLENSQYNAKKEFEIILVPEKTGEIKVDPIDISYFDTETGTYKKAQISGTTLSVKGGNDSSGGNIQSNNGGGYGNLEKVSIDQISYNPENEGYLIIQFKKEHLYFGLVILGILLLLSLAFVLVTIFRGKGDKELKNLFNQIQKSHDKNDMYNIFNNMIKYKYNISLKANSKDTVIEKLEEYGLVSTVLEVMDFMENKKDFNSKDEVYLKGKIKDIYRKISA